MESTARKLYESHTSFVVLDRLSVTQAKDDFLDFREQGVIRARDDFEDETWHTTDEYANVGLYFNFSAADYESYQNAFRLSYKGFTKRIKAFSLYLMGQNALVSIENFLLDIKHLMEKPLTERLSRDIDFNMYHPMTVSDFLSMLPAAEKSKEIDRLIQRVEKYAEARFQDCSSNARTLADFETYAIFNDIINEYWKTDLTDEERLFYYPLYIWWNLTGCIPLRPREFLLTPRDCLTVNEDNEYFLTLRRNRIKGGHRSLSYKITDDYFTTTYKIPETIGKEIQNYLNLTEGLGETRLETLFLTAPHYKKWNRKANFKNRFFTYVNMTTLLRYFFEEVVFGRYGYHFISEDTGRHLGEKEIRQIHLGDARHIALINLMFEGGTPVLAMFLAGHNNTEMSFAYSTNLSSMIECRTYRQYRHYLDGDVKYRISPPAVIEHREDFVPLRDGGKCYSQKYRDGSIEDCVKCVGGHGEIGHCPSCCFYRNQFQSYFQGDDIYKNRIEQDCKLLKEAIELVRSEKGSEESIGEALLNIRASSYSYEQYLIEKHLTNNN